MVELEPEALNGTNRLRLYVFANHEAGQALLVAQIFGKGASGAAVQNLNLMLGLNPAAGLGEGVVEAG